MLESYLFWKDKLLLKLFGILNLETAVILNKSVQFAVAQHWIKLIIAKVFSNKKYLENISGQGKTERII